MVKINCEGINNKFISSKKDVKYNISNSFTKILNSEKSEAMKRNEEILNKKINSSNNVKHFNKILGIGNDKDINMYLKDNGKVDVKRMLDEYGGKVKTNELRELSKIVTGMFKEELVDEEDYFYALKWIATKAKQKSTIINIKKKEFEVITSLDRE